VSDDLPFTGERFVPGTHGEIWIEHWHRYHFAARFAAGKRVLDVACGEGYGTAMLARVAANVTGVDISGEAVAHAKAAYAGLANASFVEASCTRIPLADASIDVAVSFETVEHIEAQEEFLRELARVLVPGGVLVISSPNKREYTDRRGFHNEFHVKELYREELERLVAPHFPEMAWYGQRPSFFSVIAPQSPGPAAGELFEVAESDPQGVQRAFTAPLYFVLVASRGREALAAMPPAISVLADRDDWVHRDYEKVMADQVRAVERIAFVEKLVDERDQSVAGLQAQLAESRGQTAAVEAEIARVLAEVRRLEADLRATIAARDATIGEKQREIDRRGGLRWWLRLPLHRFGILK
jgi:ubiquinone/menaquinone biosynthesis C-methylase UbiE